MGVSEAVMTPEQSRTNIKIMMLNLQDKMTGNPHFYIEDFYKALFEILTALNEKGHESR